MSLMGFLARWKGQPQLVELGDSVAAQSLDRVWPLVEGRAGELGAHEMRGYVRARSRGIVRELVRRVVAEQGRILATRTDELTELAVSALVRLVAARHRSAMAIRTSRRRAA